MSDIFKEDKEFKRVIFNVEMRLAERLEWAKEQARSLGKRLDVDSAVDKALEKFLKKAEKKLAELGGAPWRGQVLGRGRDADDSADESTSQQD